MCFRKKQYHFSPRRQRHLKVYIYGTDGTWRTTVALICIGKTVALSFFLIHTNTPADILQMWNVSVCAHQHGGVKNARIHKWKTFIYFFLSSSFIYLCNSFCCCFVFEIYRKRVPLLSELLSFSFEFPFVYRSPVRTTWNGKEHEKKKTQRNRWIW